jgi:hypothetical protein
LPGVWECPPFLKSPKTEGQGVGIRSAGYFQPGVWGRPPIFQLPPSLRGRGLITKAQDTPTRNPEGAQRDFFPLLGVWGCPPYFKLHQDWGIQGVDFRGTGCFQPVLPRKEGDSGGLERGAGFFLPGVWGCPQFSNPPRLGNTVLDFRSAGYFQPGVWGCPPVFKVPQSFRGRRGFRGWISNA